MRRTDCLTELLADLTRQDPGRLPLAAAEAWLEAVVDVLAALPWPGERAIWMEGVATLLTQHEGRLLRAARRRFCLAVLRERVAQAAANRRG